MPKLRIADMFSGAGGASSGSIRAAKALGYEVELTAINHWPVSVETHELNHPGSRHFTTSLNLLDPRELYSVGDLDALWASPECINHSKAKNGRPKCQQSRATAHCVTRWAECLLPNLIFVENVTEFQLWGPLTCGRNPQPIKARQGETFVAWIRMFESLGYQVDWRVLNAAHYGVPSNRHRLFIQAVRGDRRIIWPEPTHGPSSESDLFGVTLQTPLPASSTIDWEKPGSSIFKRSKPLVQKTKARIMVGIDRYFRGIQKHSAPLEPFFLKYYGTSTVQGIGEPFGALTANPSFSLVRSFLKPIKKADGGTPIPASDSLTSDYLKDIVSSHMDLGKAPVLRIGNRLYELDMTVRGLTANEASKAQGFDPSYLFKGTSTQIKKMVGNAVPPNVAEALMLCALSQDAEAYRNAYRPADPVAA